MLFRDVPPAHRLAQEEVFGPLLAAMPFDSEAEAVALANGIALRPGRGTVDARTAGGSFRLARKLRAGQVFINNYGAGGGVELPFGGTASPATAARRASRPCTALPPSKPLPFNMGNINFLSIAFAIFFSGWPGM
ncbi:aldehyde dehydrogenase family protein [Cupriavidus basilensis]